MRLYTASTALSTSACIPSRISCVSGSPSFRMPINFSFRFRMSPDTVTLVSTSISASRLCASIL